MLQPLYKKLTASSFHPEIFCRNPLAGVSNPLSGVSNPLAGAGDKLKAATQNLPNLRYAACDAGWCDHDYLRRNRYESFVLRVVLVI